MGAGRPPQPAKLLLLNGRGDGKDSAGRPVPKPPNFRRNAPNPPTWLTREAKAEWRRVVPGLERLDLIKAEDRASLAAYCETWSRFVLANRILRKEGLTVTNPDSGRMSKHPAVAIAEAAAMQLRQFANDFGLTPAGERNVSKRDDDRDPDEANPFAANQADADSG